MAASKSLRACSRRCAPTSAGLPGSSKDDPFREYQVASRHGANFEAARALAALVDGGDEYATVSGVRILGKMVVEDAELVEDLQRMVFEKYFHVGHPSAEAYFEFGAWAGRRYFELVPDKMIAWDSRKTTMPQVPEARVLPPHVVDRRLDGE